MTLVAFFYFCLGFSDQIGPALLDRINLAVQADTHGIELASGDAKPGKEVALEIIEFASGLHGRKQAAFGAAIEIGVSIEHRRLIIIKDRTGLVGENGALTQGEPRELH